MLQESQELVICRRTSFGDADDGEDLIVVFPRRAVGVVRGRQSAREVIRIQRGSGAIKEGIEMREESGGPVLDHDRKGVAFWFKEWFVSEIAPEACYRAYALRIFGADRETKFDLRCELPDLAPPIRPAHE